MSRADGADVKCVVVTYDVVENMHADMNAAIEAAYGPDGLGIIIVKDVPGYEEKRGALLPYAQRIGALGPDERASLEDVAAQHQLGWSHGIEMLDGKTPDVRKGSYYNNAVRLQRKREKGVW